ncbi:MAG TPA: chemotaxis protein CheB [Puia sp.]|nr:chemotaxis protein CheB [Puia sp.]
MQRQFIAAVAGSAGSHQRLLEFFDHTPHDDVSYVILQHLPATWESQLLLILSRHAKLAVQEIRHGMVIRKDTIYISPPGKYVTIRHHVFTLAERTGRVHETADMFMASLAANSGKQAIGIVLEGTLTDGTEGLRAIRDAGGLTMVQDPATCKFCSMPENAIAAGVVDKIAAIPSMPEIIQQHINEVQSRLWA